MKLTKREPMPVLGRDVILESFDARDWARAFVKTVAANQSILTDEETITTWFANALMRGYDEHRWRSKEYKRSIRRILMPWWKRLVTPLDRFGRQA